MEQGRVNIAVPIDVPFTEVNRLLEAQLKGKTFPEDKSGAFTVTVRSVKLAASGDRLLISLRVKANEKKSWFGLGAEATVHVWGKPVLDREPPDAAARPTSRSTSNRRRPSGCSARPRAPRSHISRRRWRRTRRST